MPWLITIYTSFTFNANEVKTGVLQYMDEFTIYNDTFKEALANLEKVLKRCKEVSLSLNNEKYYMLLT